MRAFTDLQQERLGLETLQDAFYGLDSFDFHNSSKGGLHYRFHYRFKTVVMD